MISNNGNGSGRLPRVLHVGKFYPPHWGGMETHLEALCQQLKSSLDLRVVVAGESGELRIDEVLDGIAVTRMRVALSLAATPICPGLSAEIRATAPDLVHLHWPNPAAVLAFLASGYRGPLVVTYHSDVIRQRIMGALFEPILHRFLRRAQAIIATSPRYLESSPVLLRHRERCKVVPLGIGLREIDTRDHEAEARIRAQCAGKPIILGVGRLVYYKGFEYLLRALQQVPEAQLLLIGEGPLRPALQALANEAGISGRVLFLGNVLDARPYFHACDLFVLPSIARSEAFGIVQLEAMAAGKPVINTDLDSGVPYVSLDGKTGYTVPACEPDALAKAIQKLLSHSERRAAFGAAARERVEELFTVQKMAAETARLYDRALAVKRRVQ